MTEFFGKLFDRLYSEKDFSINVATFVSGIAGVTCYLLFHDNVLTLFAFIIVFPVMKLLAGGFYRRLESNREKNTAEQRLTALYDSLSDSEKAVVMHFVHHGGSVMTWRQMDRLVEAETGVESLFQRGLLGTSTTVDGMRETFELDLTLFSFAYKHYRPQVVSTEPDE